MKVCFLRFLAFAIPALSISSHLYILRCGCGWLLSTLSTLPASGLESREGNLLASSKFTPRSPAFTKTRDEIRSVALLLLLWRKLLPNRRFVDLKFNSLRFPTGFDNVIQREAPVGYQQLEVCGDDMCDEISRGGETGLSILHVKVVLYETLQTHAQMVLRRAGQTICS